LIVTEEITASIHTDDGHFKGRVVSYELRWKDRRLDLAKVEELQFNSRWNPSDINRINRSLHPRVRMKDGTEISLGGGAPLNLVSLGGAPRATLVAGRSA
jgi:hypothetical protein